jgi:hypothetical protein
MQTLQVEVHQHSLLPVELLPQQEVVVVDQEEVIIMLLVLPVDLVVVADGLKREHLIQEVQEHKHHNFLVH